MFGWFNNAVEFLKSKVDGSDKQSIAIEIEQATDVNVDDIVDVTSWSLLIQDKN